MTSLERLLKQQEDLKKQIAEERARLDKANKEARIFARSVLGEVVERYFPSWNSIDLVALDAVFFKHKSEFSKCLIEELEPDQAKNRLRAQLKEVKSTKNGSKSQNGEPEQAELQI